MMFEDEQPKVNIVPCIKWVKQGVAKANPDKIVLDERELAVIIKKAKEDLETAGCNASENEESEKEEATEDSAPVPPPAAAKMDAENTDEFNFSNYDNEGEDNDAVLGIGNLAIYENEDENQGEAPEYGTDSEAEDDLIKPTDNLILVGHVEGDMSVMEVYVYNEEEGSLYVHHDFMLPSFPLCIEWLNFDPSDSNPGNLCAVGTMEPIIEVWDLDICNGLESAYVLGEQKLKKKKKLKKPKGTLRRGHSDAVLTLSWNESYQHILGSGSADHSVLLWDLNIGKPSEDIKVFKEKVQAIQWHPFEAHSLLTGSCDKQTRVFDCRANPSSNCLAWQHTDEVESVTWNTFEPFCYLAGTSDGYLTYVDCRNQAEPLWSFKAHEKEVTGLYVSSKCPGLVSTASNDGTLSTWDLYSNDVNFDNNEQKSTQPPTKVGERDGGVGMVQCLGSCPNNPFAIGIGGDKKTTNFKVMDFRNNEGIQSRFASRKLIEIKVEEDQ